MIKKSLENIGIVITRPQRQAKKLAQLIKDAGGNPIIFPTIDIIPSPATKSIQQIIAHLYHYQLIIFTSSNAVIHAKKFIEKYHQLANQNIKIAAIGQGTAECLEQYYIKVDLLPKPPFNSEHLLEILDLNAYKNNKILIITGLHGREVLYETIKKYHIQVDRAEVYQRVLPQANTKMIEELWQQKKIHVMMTTSNLGLENLMTLFADKSSIIQDIPHIVISERGYRLAKDYGIKKVFNASGADDYAILNVIRAHLNLFKQGLHYD